MGKRTAISSILLATLALAGCATPQERRDAEAAEIAAAVESGAADVEAAAEAVRAEVANMSPAEEEAMSRRLDAGLRRDFENVARRCGTAVHIPDGPNVLESIVVIRADATPAQIGCVQDDYPLALPAAIGDELPGVLRNCELPEARLRRGWEGRGYELSLPAEIYAVRDRAPTARRIACLTLWARERGIALTLPEAPY
jgi:outer membrane murein-binding lipoprotein Lpp